jgi:hypothetical protein
VHSEERAISLWLKLCVIDHLQGLQTISLFGNELRTLRGEMKDYVLPRHLTNDQVNSIAEFLDKFQPREVTFEVINNDREAGAYRDDIEKALKKGGCCLSCRQIIDDRTTELDQILASAEHTSHVAQQETIKKVRASLKCNLTIAGVGLPCEWEGNAARYWPTTIPGIRAVLFPQMSLGI